MAYCNIFIYVRVCVCVIMCSGRQTVRPALKILETHIVFRNLHINISLYYYAAHRSRLQYLW